MRAVCCAAGAAGPCCAGLHRGTASPRAACMCICASCPVRCSWQVIRKTRKAAAKTALAIKQQMLAAPGQGDEAAASRNPFLAAPTVEYVGGGAPAGAGPSRAANGDGAGSSRAGGDAARDVLRPVSAAFEPVLGPLGDGDDMAGSEAPKVNWQQGQEAASGAARRGGRAVRACSCRSRLRLAGPCARAAQRRWLAEALARDYERPRVAGCSASGRAPRSGWAVVPAGRENPSPRAPQEPPAWACPQVTRWTSRHACSARAWRRGEWRRTHTLRGGRTRPAARGQARAADEASGASGAHARACMR
jgi:hypothetical protein